MTVPEKFPTYCFFFIFYLLISVEMLIALIFCTEANHLDNRITTHVI